MGYHYVISWDGTLTQTRDHDEEGAHCLGMNKSSIGVCFIGHGDFYHPSPEQLKTWQWLYTQLSKQFNLTPNDIHPHRFYSNKTCHGALLSDDYYARVLNQETEQERLKRIYDELYALVTRLTALIAKRRMR